MAGATVDLENADESIHRAESAVVLGQWERAWAVSQVAMFTARRGFLPGEDAVWIDEVRRHLDEVHVRALEAYAAAGLGLGGTELAAARDAGRTLVKLAPLRESGHRLLMRALAAEGNPADALLPTTTCDGCSARSWVSRPAKRASGSTSTSWRCRATSLPAEGPRCGDREHDIVDMLAWSCGGSRTPSGVISARPW